MSGWYSRGHLMPKGWRDQRHLRISCFVSSAAVLCSTLLVILQKPASGYEFSLYDAYPWYLWVLLGIPIAMPLVVFSAFGLPQRGILSLLTVLCGAVSMFLFVSLPYFRGYAFYNEGDSLTHAGFIVDILRDGRFGRTNIYPVTHIWIVFTSLTSDIGYREVMSFAAQWFYVPYILFMYLFARVIGMSRLGRMTVLYLSLIPLYGYVHLFVFPSAESFFLVPMTLFLITKSRIRFHWSKTPYSAALIAILVLFPWFHPETSLFLLVILLVGGIPKSAVDNHNTIRKVETAKWFDIRVPSGILGVGLLAWLSATVAFAWVLQSTFLSPGVSPVQGYLTIIQGVNIGLMQITELAISTYGASAVLLIIGILVSAQTFRRSIRERGILSIDRYLSTLFLIFVGVFVLFMLRDLIIGTRPIKYALMFGTFITGLWISQLLEDRKGSPNKVVRRFPKKALIVLITVILISVSIATTYPSPRSATLNSQVTQMDIQGMEFLFEERDQTHLIMAIVINQARFADGFFGVEPKKVGIRYGNDSWPVRHFGYDKGELLGDQYTEDMYLIIDKRSQLLYPTLFPQYSEFWRFDPSDFSRLGSDPTVQVFLDNGEIHLMYVISSG